MQFLVYALLSFFFCAQPFAIQFLVDLPAQDPARWTSCRVTGPLGNDTQSMSATAAKFYGNHFLHSAFDFIFHQLVNLNLNAALHISGCSNCCG
jgi:hypothetical protein